MAPLTAALRGSVAIVAAGYVVLYAVLVCLRVRYPFDLEWLEGACVDHVRTILAGRPLYARPSLDFIPLTYTPGYFYLAAALSKVMGVGLLPLRLISIASSFGMFAVIYRLVARETGAPSSGALAAGLFAAMFGWTGGWFDIARNDSLFLLLALAAVYVLRWHPSARAAMVAGVLISLSFLVKQTGLIIAVPLALYCAARGWRVFLGFSGVVAVIVVGTTMGFDRAFDGWYRYYIYAVPRQHPVAAQSWLGFWRYDLMQPLPVALVFSLAYMAWRMTQPDRTRPLFYLLMSAGFFAGAWVSRLHSLSFINVVLPAYAAVAIVFAIGVHDAIGRTIGRYRVGAAVCYLVALAQLIKAGYLPQTFVPNADDVRAGEQLLGQIQETRGEVFLPYHGYLPARAGHATEAHAVVLADVIRGGMTEVERGLSRELDEALRAHRFEWIDVIESFTPVREWLPLDRYYRPADPLVTRQSRFWRREIRYVPR
jgi:hypothetical protein